MIDDPTRFQLPELSRRQLAMLGREWLLHGHLQDRVGMPLVMADGTREEMQAVAIDDRPTTPSSGPSPVGGDNQPGSNGV